MTKKKNKFPTKHKYKVGDIVVFKFAGSWHRGEVIELTTQVNGHATYTTTTSANGRIYPCLGLDGSSDTGWINTK
jgi:hypothetical protein